MTREKTPETRHEPTRRVDLARYGSCTLDQDGCTTCGDVGIPVRVVRLVDDHVALCEDRTGQRAEVATDFVPEAAPGHVLLVHMSTAIARVPVDAPSESHP